MLIFHRCTRYISSVIATNKCDNTRYLTRCKQKFDVTTLPPFGAACFRIIIIFHPECIISLHREICERHASSDITEVVVRRACGGFADANDTMLMAGVHSPR